jgi:hypothetical protein
MQSEMKRSSESCVEPWRVLDSDSGIECHAPLMAISSCSGCSCCRCASSHSSRTAARDCCVWPDGAAVAPKCASSAARAAGSATPVS